MPQLFTLSLEANGEIIQIGEPAPLGLLQRRVADLIAKHRAWVSRGCPLAELGQQHTCVEGADLLAEEVGGEKAYVWSGTDWEEF